MSRKTLIVTCLACLVAGYLVSTVPGFDPVNPFVPKHDRPIVTLLRRLAKVGLWVTVFAEPQPAAVEQQYAARHCETAMICHAEGW